jgi:hypothetical protein
MSTNGIKSIANGHTNSRRQRHGQHGVRIGRQVPLVAGGRVICIDNGRLYLDIADWNY